LLNNKAVYWNSLFIITLFHDEKLIIAACVLSQNSKILSQFLNNKKYKIFISRFLNIWISTMVNSAGKSQT